MTIEERKRKEEKERKEVKEGKEGKGNFQSAIESDCNRKETLQTRVRGDGRE